MTTMTSTTTRRAEAGALLKLAGPLIVNNLAIAGMQFADAVMSGRLGAESLAAVAIGGSLWQLGFIGVLGLLMAISPITARHFGAGSFAGIGRYTRQGMWLGAGIGVVLIVVAHLVVLPLLTIVGIDPSFRTTTSGYVNAIMWGAPAIFIFLALRFTTEGIGSTRPIMYTSILALATNVVLNYVLMYGRFGAPKLGAIGCGYASAITMWLIMIVLTTYMMSSRQYRKLEIFSRVGRIRPGILKEIVSLGLPIAVTITAEVGLFSAVSILMGRFGAEITAAHQIAINFATTTFMVPLAISSAITIRIGHALGAGNASAARFSGVTGIWLCALFMTGSALFLLAFRGSVVSLYTNDSAVRNIAISLLLMAALFQIADGVQIGTAGALRGYKDTRIPMIINMFAYWAVAFPLAWLAAVVYVLPPNAIWAGFVAGLGVAAILLPLRFNRLSAAMIVD